MGLTGVNVGEPTTACNDDWALSNKIFDCNKDACVLLSLHNGSFSKKKKDN